MVAPYTGAWIEILNRRVTEVEEIVAPYTGAWIEIWIIQEASLITEGRSLHGSVD